MAIVNGVNGKDQQRQRRVNKTLYLLKGCEKCYSDVFRDRDEWRCFQSGRVYHPKHSPMELQMGAEDFEQSETASEAEPGRKRPKVRRSARHFNAMLAAT